MLFDEGLIGLEEAEQNKILNLLLALKNDHTIVMVTHDKNILKYADKIIVMENQQVVESGTLKELIESQGRYYQLFEKGTE